MAKKLEVNCKACGKEEPITLMATVRHITGNGSLKVRTDGETQRLCYPCLGRTLQRYFGYEGCDYNPVPKINKA